MRTAHRMCFIMKQLGLVRGCFVQWGPPLSRGYGHMGFPHGQNDGEAGLKTLLSCNSVWGAATTECTYCGLNLRFSDFTLLLWFPILTTKIILHRFVSIMIWCLKGFVTLIIFHVRCGTLNSNQFKGCKYVVEFPLIQKSPFGICW